MSQARSIAGLVAVSVLLAACAAHRDSEPVESAAANAAARAGAEEIIVTGQHVPGVIASLATIPPPPPPPPPPAPAAPRLMRMQEPNFPRPVQVEARDRFTATQSNPFRQVREEPVSSFSIDVDTASYAFVRASLTRNVLPQPAAVRVEELVNYFPYAYAPARSAAEPFSTDVAVMPSPWTAGRKIVRIGIRGYEITRAVRPRANLVFLIDTSGSMSAPNRLPLVKQSLAMLLEQLDPNDRVAIVTYAGQAGTALEPTRVADKARILAVLDRLGAGGSTAGAEGIRQAYALAQQNLDPRGVNRVILATDGDFNVGITDPDALKGFVERERAKGVFLSVLGFGMGNYNDALMQTLAQNGNGAAAYIDTVAEARKTLVEEASATLFPIAKDVKIQVEFNPATVAEYRLIGYETRMLAREDFENDRVDAGEVGSGQTVTALYEIVPVGGPRASGDLRYARPTPATATGGGEYGFVKIRYKLPKASASRLLATPIRRAGAFARLEDAPRDARFAVGVAAFGELLRGGKYSGTTSYDDVLRIAGGARGDDPFGYRAEFVQLVRQAKTAASMAQLER
ncbi:Ca-activated chloride channel family protein [Sphingomonas guangdongensis]|uniref:Ca-activated chloride channel family protein n=1 Tax=Sphingomonas guangdongensis TaxID=1141890 RepID=A0A285Q9X7_9SPHN|nr:von Willebrand factor type A domain-containing protein [Sphingomonas guangdongensis]SOB78730.1 Ca-activated chloride channel family protein [Sphingomonas guangdongensis]